jgi:tetratricopeptide (TPR) repeat protein
MVEWSYELLDERDRRLFERLAVFAGGWHADAVARVAGHNGDDVLGRLERLVEQSLVSTRSQSRSTRYNLLEPVRAYAEGCLKASGHQDEARDAHAAFFVQLAEEADAGLRTPDEGQWADRLDQEMANFRAAHRWLMQRGNGDGTLRLASALLAYGFGVGVAELHHWAEEAAERFASMGHPALAAAWATAAWGAWHGGDLLRAEAFVTRSLAAADDGSPRLQMALQMAGVVHLTLGRFDRAVELLHQSVEASRAAEDNLCLVYALGTYGLALAYDGRFEPALHMADAGLGVAAAGGNTTIRAWANYYAGEVRLETHPEEASALFRRSLAEGTSSRLLVGAAGLSAVSLEARHGDPRAALAQFPELIEHWQRSGAWNQMWVTLRILVETLDRLGESAPAAVISGAISASASAPPIVGPDASRLSVALEHLREDLGPDVLRHHEEQGAELGDNGAMAFALEAIRSILCVTPPA